jgi:FG-GAP-like repeat/Fibronectin type III domain
MLRTRLSLALLGLLLMPLSASAQTVNLAWDASTDSSVTGYVVKWGTRAGNYTSSIDVGNRTTWSVSPLTPDQKYYFVVTSYSASGLASVPSNEVSNDALIVTTGGTLNDQRPSFFWYNKTAGKLMSWHVSGTNVIDTREVNLANTDTNWKVAGTGDLNGDGFTDIVWRHQTQGWLAYWFLQNNTVIGSGSLSVSRASDINWELRAVGDVNGDHYADLIWQHTDGSLAVWTMVGATVSSTQVLSIPKVAVASWKVAGVVDANRDGYGDLIFQDTVGGALATWFLRGNVVLGTYYLSIPKQADSNWRVQAAGEIDGSGVPKILWRHIVSGWVAEWTLSGYVVTGTFFFNPNNVDNLNWDIVGAR